MSSYRRYYLPRVSWSDVKGGVWRIQPYNVTDYFFIFRVQNLLTSASATFPPTCLPLLCFRLGHFFYSATFPPTCLPLLCFRLGHFSYSTNFPPTCLLLDGFRLGHFPYSTNFPPTCLQASLQRCMCLGDYHAKIAPRYVE